MDNLSPENIAERFEELRAKISTMTEQERGEFREQIEASVISVWTGLQESSKSLEEIEDDDLRRERLAVYELQQQVLTELKRVRNILVPPKPGR
jgi:hypothetical protein